MQPIGRHLGVTKPRQYSWFFKRGFPLLIAFTIVVVLLTSAVQRNLLVVAGTAADIVLFGYAGLLAYLGFFRAQHVWIHKIGAVLAVFTWGGRGGGFIELALSRGTWDLAGAIAERLLLAAALVLWHSTLVYAVATEQEAARAAS